MHTGYLVLENGHIFTGKRFGAMREATGELVFTTAMVGYLETLTDPSYCGQIVVQTFPLIGNYGVIPADFESAGPRLCAYVVREWCDAPSNFRSEGDLDGFLRAQGIPGLYGVDTRALTRILRSAGVMRAKLSDTPEALFEEAAPIGGVMDVTCAAPYTQTPENKQRRVALMDFGTKRGIATALLQRGCEVVTFPAGTTAEDILACDPDGIMLSNGPGDPSVNTDIIAQVRRLTKSGLPMFGICLGHQLLALSQGATAHKLKFGHRGANQPARHVATGRVYVTCQNHGYAISLDTLPDSIAPSYINANDGSCEGLEFKEFPAFSVQFHPEACAGPLDTSFLFDAFIEKMGR